MKSKIKKYLYKKMFESQNRKIISKSKFILPKDILDNYKELQFCNFGKKNKKKIFYVIQRKIGGGFFSNLLHLMIQNSIFGFIMGICRITHLN